MRLYVCGLVCKHTTYFCMYACMEGSYVCRVCTNVYVCVQTCVCVCMYAHLSAIETVIIIIMLLTWSSCYNKKTMGYIVR